jgi:hypothetical protein
MSSNPWSKTKPKSSKPKIFLAVTGITVSPAITHIDLAHDPASFTLKYTNSTDQPIQLTLSAKDFTSLEEGWRIKFLDENNAKNYHYSLSSWLSFSPPSLLLKPGASSDVQVSVRGQSLSGGGHYASVIADIASAPPTGETIAIKSELVSLVFIRASTGFEREEAKITDFSAALNNAFSLPQTYVLHLDNSGNTELIPHGLVSVRNFLNHEVARGILNEDSLISLPESVRRYDIPISVRFSHWSLPGPYQASLTLTYGNNQTLSSDFQFFSFGSQVNLLIMVFIPLVLFIFIRLRLKKVKRR